MVGAEITVSPPHLFSMRPHKEAQREMHVAGETVVLASSGGSSESSSSEHRQPDGSRAPCTSATEESDQLWVGGDYSDGDRLHRLGINRGKKTKISFFNIILQRKLGPFNRSIPSNISRLDEVRLEQSSP